MILPCATHEKAILLRDLTIKQKVRPFGHKTIDKFVGLGYQGGCFQQTIQLAR